MQNASRIDGAKQPRTNDGTKIPEAGDNVTSVDGKGVQHQGIS